MYCNGAKKALMYQMRRIRLQDQEEAAEDPVNRIRQVELDTIKMLLENHLLLANDVSDA